MSYARASWLFYNPQKAALEGLLEAVLDALTGLYTSKLIGITTDGESANIIKDHGLWKLMSQALKKTYLLCGVLHKQVT